MRTPMMLVRSMNQQEVAVRFWHIGGRQRFMTLLQRFRGEFLLARSQKIEGLDWLILRRTQMPEVTEFCRRNGLQEVEDE